MEKVYEKKICTRWYWRSFKTYVDGAMSILTGIAGNKSIQTEQPINVLSLVDLPGYRNL